ncbi:MAG: hypothetical protein JW957_09120 [Candidatus Omnitrophica bacterium]|nr:hypothetical protein [Candidatus Omnitrophota bacterium]
MNDRERFLGTMRFEKVDHPPFDNVNGVWADTLARWHREGFPLNDDFEGYFGISMLASRKMRYAGPSTGLYPLPAEKIISENSREIIKTDSFGRTIRDFKDSTTMPEWIDFPVKKPADLERIIKEHFDLSFMEERWPAGQDAEKKGWADESRDYILYLDGGCYYGILRNLAGVEYSSYLFHDAPGLVDELFERINLICLEGIKRICPNIKIDYLGFGEDIAYKTSTLISPGMFKRFLLPRYKKVCDTAKSYGVDIFYYDSDGNLNPFMDLYFEAGINLFAPCEVAADMDPVDLRKRYGKKIRMVGGIDKREIAKGKENIKREVMKKASVIEEGGYIPGIDHSVSSDISLENYKYFINLLKEIYGI